MREKKSTVNATPIVSWLPSITLVKNIIYIYYYNIMDMKMGAKVQSA